MIAAGCGGGANNSTGTGGAGHGSGSGGGNSNGSASGQGAGSGESSGQINASLTGHHYFREVDDHTNSAGQTGEVIETAKIDWTVTITGSLAGLKNGTVVPKLTMLTGTVTQQGSGTASAISCAGSLSAAPNLTSGDLGTFFSIFYPGDTDETLVGNFGVGPTTNAGSPDYLLEGNLPGVSNPQFIVSSNTSPSQSGCNTGGLTLYYGQPKGSPLYSSWVQVLDPIADFTPAGESTTGASHSFNWSGTIPAPPGYTSTVTEQDSETYTFAPVS